MPRVGSQAQALQLTRDRERLQWLKRPIECRLTQTPSQPDARPPSHPDTRLTHTPSHPPLLTPTPARPHTRTHAHAHTGSTDTNRNRRGARLTSFPLWRLLASYKLFRRLLASSSVLQHAPGGGRFSRLYSSKTEDTEWWRSRGCPGPARHDPGAYTHARPGVGGVGVGGWGGLACACAQVWPSA